jgi:hypothetical protein
MIISIFFEALFTRVIIRGDHGFMVGLSDSHTSEGGLRKILIVIRCTYVLYPIKVKE